MIRRERRVTGPRFRYIVAGERGAVEYVTLAGIPAGDQLPLPAGPRWVQPVPCNIVEGPCYGDGTVLGGRELCERWRAAGKDDEVICRALGDRYSRRA